MVESGIKRILDKYISQQTLFVVCDKCAQKYDVHTGGFGQGTASCDVCYNDTDCYWIQ
jgi:hypothetical protein